MIKGQVAIVKHADSADTQVEPPLDGAVFDVFLKSAGSYDAAKDTERQQITIDENGFAQTGNLPYGIYTVEEISTKDGLKLAAPFDVSITQDGKVYRYILDDPVIAEQVKIVKTDAGSGKTIPLAGATFQIKNMATGEWVSQSYNYPTPTTIDTFVTADDGTLVMPENLPYGNYGLAEVQAPYGYTLNTTPVPFSISDPNGAPITVTMADTPVMGTVTVTKTGEMLSSATKSGGDYGDVYTPVYTVQGVQGATFQIIADEDIVTPDGTVHAHKGDVVDTITTGADGTATSKPLYLGSYHAVEVSPAPSGFLLDDTPLTFTLTYQDQNTPLVSSQVGLQDSRAKAAISLTKTAEQVKVDNDGNITYVQAPAKGIVFGLYAKDDIKTADGNVIIPAGSLLNILTTDADGKAVSTADIPFGEYFVKELSTNANLVLNNTEYDVTAAYADDQTPVVTVAAGNGQPIENQMIKGYIQIVKTDENGRPLPGVGFTLKGKNAGVTITLTTDDKGTATSALLPYDEYIITETKTQESYVLYNTTHTLLLSQNGGTIQIGFINQKITGSVKLEKTDENGNKLPGATFELYAPDGTDLGSYTTDDDGTFTVPNLPYGQGYKLVETKAPTGYQLDSGANVFDITQNGVTVTINAVDKPVAASVSPSTSSVSPVPAISVTAPMRNPATGDNSNPGLWIGLGGVALGGLIAVLIIRRKKKKYE